MFHGRRHCRMDLFPRGVLCTVSDAACYDQSSNENSTYLLLLFSETVRGLGGLFVIIRDLSGVGLFGVVRKKPLSKWTEI